MVWLNKRWTAAPGEIIIEIKNYVMITVEEQQDLIKFKEP